MTKTLPKVICAFEVNENGSCKVAEISAEELPQPESGYIWLHVDISDPETGSWLRRVVPENVGRALTQAETRPRCLQMDGGLFLTLRGVNLNPGANSDDMVSIRLWRTDTMVISARIRKVWAVDQLRQEMSTGKGPASANLFLAELAFGLTKRIESVSLELVERTDELEEHMLEPSPKIASGIAAVRQSVIKLRRFVRPQNEALAELAGGYVLELEPACANHLRETANRTTRIVEELDATSDRLQALQDHADVLHASSLGRNSYILSVVAAIFLPLGFLTGLFGINVGGMPGTEASYGFWAVTIASVILGIVLFLVFRFLKWL